MRAVDELKALLATANHILDREDVVDAFGHISARHPENSSHYILSCSRSPALVSVGDMMEFDLDGRVIGNDSRTPYLERFIHAAVYQARRDVQAVIHHHAHDLIPFGVTGTPIRPLIHVAGAIGTKVPVWDIADRFGDTSLLVTDMAQARDLAAALDVHSAALMRGHGTVVVGKSIREAVLTAIYLQVNASVDLKSRGLGEVKYLSAGEISRSLPNLLGESAATRAWEYFERRSRMASR
jgi:ribulose-5-phosphate 4-epimerase/fuculose-1-phosphate aldolase